MHGTVAKERLRDVPWGLKAEAAGTEELRLRTATDGPTGSRATRVGSWTARGTSER